MSSSTEEIEDISSAEMDIQMCYDCEQEFNFEKEGAQCVHCEDTYCGWCSMKGFECDYCYYDWICGQCIAENPNMKKCGEHDVLDTTTNSWKSPTDKK